MTDTLVLFLPANDTPWRWLRISGDTVSGRAVSGRGEGLPLIAETDEAYIAIAPADAVTLHWAELPDRSLAQAVAAARMLAAEASATPIADLHVAVGREGDKAERPIGVVSVSRMREWLGELAAHGIDPECLLPAPMLLPRPEQGYLRADLGGAGVVRGPTSGFADEARLTELVTGGVAPDSMTRDALEAAIVAAVAAPALDLRQGMFARNGRRMDWALLRRLGWLVAAILVVTLFITLVRLSTYASAADALQRRADLLARTGLAPGEAVNDADRQLAARLDRLRGGGMGFSRTAAAIFAAVRATPGTEVRTLGFDPGGTMRVGLGLQNEGQILDLQRHLDASGFAATPLGQFQSSAGRLAGDIQVKPR